MADKRLRTLVWVCVGLWLAFLLLPGTTARADDCWRDPLNAADCMRTFGFRQFISVALGVAATLSTVLVNVLGAMAAGAQTGATTTTGATAAGGTATTGATTTAGTASTAGVSGSGGSGGGGSRFPDRDLTGAEAIQVLVQQGQIRPVTRPDGSTGYEPVLIGASGPVVGVVWGKTPDGLVDPAKLIVKVDNPTAPPTGTQQQPQQPQQPPQQGKQQQPPKQADRFDLTVNPPNLSLRPGGSGQLSARVRRVTEKGVLPSPETTLSVSATGGQLRVSPERGAGSLQSQVTVDARTAPGSYWLQVIGYPPDGSVLHANISVQVEPPVYELRCDPKSLTLRPEEEAEFAVGVWQVLPDGSAQPAPDVKIQLTPPLGGNPFDIDPLDGSGEIKVQVRAHKEGEPRDYYVDIVATPADGSDELKGWVELKLLPQRSMVVEFEKLRWQSPCKVDLRELPELNKDRLDELDQLGGELLIRPYGALPLEDTTLECDKMVLEGRCKLVLDRDSRDAVWDDAGQGYRVTVPPARALKLDETPAGEEPINIPVAVDGRHAPQLKKLYSAARRTGTIIGRPVTDEAQVCLLNYLSYISTTPEDELRLRNEELNTWLLNTVAFARYTAESAKAFCLTLDLHHEAYSRFFDAAINAFTELLFFGAEKALGGADSLLQRYLKGGDGAIKETVEYQTRKMVGELAEREARLLATQREAAQQEMKEAIAQQENQVLQRSMGAKQLANSADANAEALLKEELEALEREMAQTSKQLAELRNKLKAMDQREAALKQLQQDAAQAGDAGQVREALGKAGQTPGVAGDPLRATLDQMAESNWKKLDALAEAIQANRDRLKNPDLLLARLRAIQTKMREELAGGTMDSAVGDLVMEQELQRVTQELNEQINAASSAAPAPYRAMARSDYGQGILGWIWWKTDTYVEGAFSWHDWAKANVPLYGRATDLLCYGLEKMVSAMAWVSNRLIAFGHDPDWVRSAVREDLRSQGVSRSQSLGLPAGFYRYPAETMTALGHSLNPHSMATSLSGGASAARSALKAGAEGQYQAERAAQRAGAYDYFYTALTQALGWTDFSAAPPDADRAAALGMPGTLTSLLMDMQDYVAAFDAAKTRGAESLIRVPSRLFEGGFTVQDFESMVDWVVWALRWTATIAGLLATATGVGAPAGAALLSAAQKADYIGAVLRIAIIAMGTLPTVIGFQYDVVIAHALLYEALYQGGTGSLDGMVVDRYYCG